MQRVRLIVRAAHLWLGLSFGALFVVLGISGALLVFYQEIDAALHPEINVTASGVVPGWNSPVWDTSLATVRRQWPERNGAWRFEVTGKPGPIAARYQPPHGGHHGQRIMVWLAPDGSRVLREAAWGSYAMTWIYDLHMQLAAGPAWRDVVGWAGLIILVLLLTGLWAWWPRGSWRKALRYKRGASFVRTLRDIHKLAGLASLPLLLMLVVTGVMLALPDQSNAVLTQVTGPIDETPSPQSAVQTRPPLTISEALAIAHSKMPEGRLAWVEVPGQSDGPFMVRIQQPSDPSYRFPHSYVFIDQFSGAVVGLQDSLRASASTTVNNWLHPLHDASVGGLNFRLLIVCVGLVPALLFGTGLARWRLREAHVEQSLLPDVS
ncbi:PepSY-associated TM helix domain-containing protein [Novosphingobium olei]|uniref:PepSY domain-containing protein n=1 Tax=Novosphingobium olei TaxID=2728851 RepID=A0A7Y0G9G7_9SPHN|nr:PepSY-associated TM helix domain-containing protein [Novosphingobium olei]NML93995.1 PepSY domain-containing protein [Novosphingobium olei]